MLCVSCLIFTTNSHNLINCLVITPEGPPLKKVKSIKEEEKNSHRRNSSPAKERPKPEEVVVEVNKLVTNAFKY